MQVPRTLAGLLSAVALAVAVATPAHAATPFTAGTGAGPQVAVADDGTGHVVWVTDAPGSTVGYCRVSAGATACNKTQTFSFPLGATAQGQNAFVFTPSATKVIIIGGCWSCGAPGTLTGRVFQWTSTNGGDSFAGPTELTGSTQFDLSDGAGAWLDDAGLFAGVGGASAVALAGATAPVQVSGFTTNYGPDIARLPGTNTLVSAVNDLSTVRYEVYSGPALTAAAINSAANWSASPQDLTGAEGDNDVSGLTAGPSGLFLSYRWFVPNDDHVGLRRFDPATKTFGAPVYIEGGDPIDNDSLDDPEVSEDGAGRLHAVWRTLWDGGRLRYTVSDATGSTFAAATTLAAHETFRRPRVAAAPDGHGFAVWTPNISGAIRVVPLDPQAESGLTPTTPTPPSTTTTTTTTPTPTPTTPTGSAKKTVKATVPGATISFGVPRGCVNPGATFTVTLTWKKQKRKGNRFVKVRRADFYIGKKRVKVDKKAPFRQKLRVTASARAGSTITLRARAFIKVKRGKSPTKSIKTTIKVCG